MPGPGGHGGGGGHGPGGFGSRPGGFGSRPGGFGGRPGGFGGGPRPPRWGWGGWNRWNGSNRWSGLNLLGWSWRLPYGYGSIGCALPIIGAIIAAVLLISGLF